MNLLQRLQKLEQWHIRPRTVSEMTDEELLNLTGLDWKNMTEDELDKALKKMVDEHE